MKTIEAYKTFDGKIFESEKKAQENADDILGAELNELIKLAGTTHRQDEFKMCLSWINNRKELKKTIAQIHAILNYEDSEED